jgi:hypothetical protein
VQAPIRPMDLEPQSRLIPACGVAVINIPTATPNKVMAAVRRRTWNTRLSFAEVSEV